MTTTAAGLSAPNLLGDSIHLPVRPCLHAPGTPVSPWSGALGTSGTVAVIGAGKMGLPLCAQYASHGWNVIAVDISRTVVDSINAGHSHVDGEPGLADAIATARAAGLLRATTDGTAAASEADVIVVIVPVMLDDEQQPDYRWMDAAVDSIAPGVRSGSTVIFETTLPVGDTRDRYAPRLAKVSGLTVGETLFVAFSPERLYSGAAIQNLAVYPKLVGGVDAPSGERAAAFYESVLDAEVALLSSSEAAEFSKLADTTYRDVNIALANEFARYADRVGVDIQEVIAAANSQPYSHIHQPGLGVGGHCIPVYPHFLLSRAPELTLVRASRAINDGQVGRVLDQLDVTLGGLAGHPVLVLGLTYRHGVKELAYSRGLPLLRGLLDRQAVVLAYDPLLSDDEVVALDAIPWRFGDTTDAIAIIAQTADPIFDGLDPAWFPRLRVVVDGRNALRAAGRWPGVRRMGIGT